MPLLLVDFLQSPHRSRHVQKDLRNILFFWQQFEIQFSLDWCLFFIRLFF